MYKNYFFSVFFLFIVISLNAQKTKEHKHDEDHAHIAHFKNEFGLALLPVYFVNERELSYGIHLHYIHNIGESRFGIGLGYERVFDEHKHNTIGIAGSFRPIEPLSFNISPGISFEGSEISDLKFAIHFETTYEFELGRFHIGPLLEIAYDPEDYHLSLGLHLGYGF